MRLLVGTAVPAELRAALDLVAAHLERPELSAVHADVTAIAGVPDPFHLAVAPGPVIAVPVDAPSRRVDSALMAHAAVVALLDEGDAPGPTWDGPVVLAGLPRTRPSGRSELPLDSGERTRGAADAVRAEAGPVSLRPTAHGVSWLRGGGCLSLARAVHAWDQGRAAIELPGEQRRAGVLSEAGCPRCTTSLEVIELTRTLLNAPPLARALAARGRAAAARLPDVHQVATSLIEAAELAVLAGARDSTANPARSGW